MAVIARTLRALRGSGILAPLLVSILACFATPTLEVSAAADAGISTPSITNRTTELESAESGVKVSGSYFFMCGYVPESVSFAANGYLYFSEWATAGSTNSLYDLISSDHLWNKIFNGNQVSCPVQPTALMTYRSNGQTAGVYNGAQYENDCCWGPQDAVVYGQDIFNPPLNFQDVQVTYDYGAYANGALPAFYQASAPVFTGPIAAPTCVTC